MSLRGTKQSLRKVGDMSFEIVASSLFSRVLPRNDKKLV